MVKYTSNLVPARLYLLPNVGRAVMRSALLPCVVARSGENRCQNGPWPPTLSASNALSICRAMSSALDAESLLYASFP
eukprot:6193634-Pleurochrysis_carterae.AAC.1